MEREYVLQELIEFFLSEFEEDAAGVGDYLAQGGIDPDEFVRLVRGMSKNLSEAGR